MTIQAHLESKRRSADQRGDVRKKIRLSALGKSPSGGSSEVLIHDLSTGGMLIETQATLKAGDTIEMELPRTGVRRVDIVWSSGAFFGCRFVDPVPPAAVSAALLKSTPEGSSAPYTATTKDAPEANFAARLAALRNEHGWSLEQLAERLGVTRQAVWYWETGQRLPRANLFGKIADEFGVMEQDLLGDPGRSLAGPGMPLVAELKREIANRLGCSEDGITIRIEF